MKKYILFLIFLTNIANGNSGLSSEAPECVNAPVKTSKQAKCIALFYASFISVIEPLGAEWDVDVREEGDYWLIFPKVPNSFVSANTLLYKINRITGAISEFRPKT